MYGHAHMGGMQGGNMTQERNGAEKGRGRTLEGGGACKHCHMWVSDGCTNLTHTTLPDHQPSYTSQVSYT